MARPAFFCSDNCLPGRGVPTIQSRMMDRAAVSRNSLPSCVPKLQSRKMERTVVALKPGALLLCSEASGSDEDGEAGTPFEHKQFFLDDARE